MGLADNRCIPCRGGVPPLDAGRSDELLQQLDEGWHLNDDGHLEREYTFGNFNGAMTLANAVAAIADEENHHPDLYVAWGKCRVEIWTHKIGGLTESDFFFAAKVDRAHTALRSSG
jgi:4a-hydroxytetrahydrobiopterin dehydratase